MEQKKVTPGKLAAAVAAVVILAAALIMVIGTGLKDSAPETASAAVEATIPADGNPDDETAKGTYTASDEDVLAAADTVVAWIGEDKLTNEQLQTYYWLEIQNFAGSYGQYASMLGLDLTKPLDSQSCTMGEIPCTWQQFFLASALNTWKNCRVLTVEAENAGFQLEAELQAQLDGLEEMMDQSAAMYGMTTGEFLKENMGPGGTMEGYQYYMEQYMVGNRYFGSLLEQNQPTDEEVEAYFAEHEDTYAENGLKREDKYVDVRHVLIMPEGATSANIRTETFDDAAWETAKVTAEELLAQFEEGDKSEESFAQLAMEHSQDGSAADGGLYTGVVQGQMVEAFNDWCFDEARKAGDYGLVETEFGYHLMYFVDSRPVWVEAVRSEMAGAKSTELMNELLGKYEMEADFGSILLGFIDLGGEEAAVEEKPGFTEENKMVLVLAGVSVAALLAAAFVIRKKEEA